MAGKLEMWMGMIVYFGLALSLFSWVFFFRKAKKFHEVRFRYETMILKPLSVTLTVLSFIHLLRRDWWVGAIFLVLTFLVGTIGQSVHPNLTAAQLEKATPEASSSTDDGQEVELSDDESFRMAKTALPTSCIVGISAGILSYHYGLLLWISIPLAIVSALIFTLLSVFAVVRLRPQN